MTDRCSIPAIHIFNIPLFRSSSHWREDQKRKMELLDIYESLPADKQNSFLNYLNQTGEVSNRERRRE